MEPTSHALVALRQAAASEPKLDTKELRERVRLGEGMLLDVRSKDGGWNYGNRTARGEDLRSYPETTAIALLGLQGRGSQGRESLGRSIDLAKKMLAETASPLARAWLTIAMRVHGVAVSDLSGEPSQDVLITALEALAAPDGNYRFMQVPA